MKIYSNPPKRKKEKKKKERKEDDEVKMAKEESSWDPRHAAYGIVFVKSRRKEGSKRN